MKAIPQYSDFELDYKKFPKRQVGGISDMNAVRRMDYRDSMFEKAMDEWMIHAEKQIKRSENSLLAQTKRAEFLKLTCENLELQIKKLKALLKELTDLAERNNFSVPYYFKQALKK